LQAIAKAIPKYQYDPDRSTFRNWLFTVVRSKFNNHLAAQARQPRLAGDTTIHEFAENEADPALEESWRREYQANLIRWASDQIQKESKAQTWDAFRRTALLGEPPEIVAGELGLSLNALYVARSRVTRRLKEAIESIEKSAASIEGLAHG
jgi:DNA-directed RNA polymerase specialized sigma24 family protein